MNTQSEKLEFLRSTFGEIKIARDGINVAVSCPLCLSGKSKKKLSINTRTWACHCWVCGVKSYNVFYIIQKHIDTKIAQTFLRLFDINLKDNGEKVLIDDDSSVSLPDNFQLLAELKSKDPDMKACNSYLAKRQVSFEDMWYFKLGAVSTGRLRRRIIVPSFDSTGKVNYFVSRSIDKDNKIRYINSRNKKTEIIFNEINIDWSRELTLVEGPFDLFKVNQNATCLLGSKLSKNSLLFRKIIENKTSILLALDPDMGSESHNIATSLFNFGCQIRMIRNKTKNDVGNMSKKEFQRLRASAQYWNKEDRLRFKIGTIGSGSIF
jgi:hypothetical protein